MAIQMTRAEYEAKYGSSPKTTQPQSQPIQMTRAEYEAKYGGAPEDKKYSEMGMGERIFTAKNPFEGQGGVLEKATDIGNIPRNLAVGGVKSGFGLLEGLSKLGQATFGRAAEGIAGAALGKDIEHKTVSLPEYATKAEGGAQATGKLAGDIGQFFIPGGAVAKGSKVIEAGVGATKLAKAAPIVGKAMQLGTRAAVGAAEVGGVTTLQTGSLEEGRKAAKFGAAMPVAGALLGKAVNAVGPGSEKFAKKLEQINLRLTPVQKKNLGKKLDDVTDFLSKQGITGTPKQRFEKVDDLYNAAEEKFAGFIKRYAPEVKANTDDIIKQVKSISGKYKNDRDALAIEKQVDEFAKLLKERHPGQISLDALNELKRSTFKGAYNKAGEKVLDGIEFEIGSILNKNLQKITNGLKVGGQDIKAFNKQYGTLIESKKLLEIAQTRAELGLIGKLLSSSVGGAIGTAVGGPIGTAAGLVAGQTGGKIIAGTAPRSYVSKALMKLSKVGKINETEAGTIKGFLLGNTKKTVLSPKEQKIADQITKQTETILSKGRNVGMTIEDVSKKSKAGAAKSALGKENPLIQEARKYKSVDEFVNIPGIKPEKVKKMTLFGSQAEGKATAKSDIDILVSVENGPMKPKIIDKGRMSYMVADESYYDDLLKAVKKEGVMMKDNKGITKTLTKSQLTDIWNKSNKKSGGVKIVKDSNKYRYHETSPDNLRSIARRGLQPKKVNDTYLYHGSAWLKDTKKGMQVEESMHGSMSFTSDKSLADRFAMANKGNNFIIDKSKLKIKQLKSWKDLEKIPGYDKSTDYLNKEGRDYLKKQGYDAIEFPNMEPIGESSATEIRVIRDLKSSEFIKPQPLQEGVKKSSKKSGGVKIKNK